MSQSKPLFIVSILKMRCPSCRKGDVFVNNSILPLGQCLKMVAHCSVCGQKMVTEHNNGPGINYALTIILFFLNLVWYGPIFGISYRDYSIYYFLVTTIMVVILLQPWLMRLSRILYLYMVVRYKNI